MKKVFALLLAALLFAGCAQQTDVAETTAVTTVGMPETDVPFFWINGEFPTIGEFSGKVDRFYAEYTPDFIPSKEYGMVIPYMTNYKEYSTGEGETAFRSSFGEYGFCTADGRIVMDASSHIRYISRATSPDGFSYYDVSLKNLDSEDYDVFYGEAHWLLPVSGEWRICLDAGFYIVGANEGVIVTARYAEDEDDVDEIVLYDYNGKKLGSIQGANNSSAFSCGLMRGVEWKDNTPQYYYFNKNGKKVLGPFDSTWGFNAQGVTAVEKDGEYYLINTEGARLSEKGYERITMLQEDDGGRSLFILYEKDSNKKYIASAAGELIRTVECDTRSLNIDFASDGEIFYYYMPMYGDDQQWYRLSDGEKIMSEEFSVMPNKNCYTPGLLLNLQEKYHHAILFNTAGETVAVLDDFDYLRDASEDHRYIAYQRTSDNGQTVYDAVKGETLLSLGANTYGSFVGEGDKYFLSTKGIAVGLYAATVAYSLYDTENGEWLFEDCRYINCYKIGETWYYNVITENASTLYDGDMNILMRLYQE